MALLSDAVCALSALLIAGTAAAQASYPEMPIRVVVGFPAGTQIDTVARLLGNEMAGVLKKPIVIENVLGASGHIAAERVARAAPDGYTLGFVGHGQLVVNPAIYKTTFDPVKDFAPVSQAYSSSLLLVVGNAVPARTVPELVGLAKAQPGALTFASAGSGSPHHLAAELFKSAAGIDIRHIPYKGPPVPDLLAGRVTMMFAPMGSLLPLVRDGKLRALAVTSSRRSAAAGEVPTMAEAGYAPFDVTIWSGFVAPAGTAPAVIEKLHEAIAGALGKPEVRARLTDLGLEAVGGSPDEFAATIRSDIPRWVPLIKASGIKAD